MKYSIHLNSLSFFFSIKSHDSNSSRFSFLRSFNFLIKFWNVLTISASRTWKSCFIELIFLAKFALCSLSFLDRFIIWAVFSFLVFFRKSMQSVIEAISWFEFGVVYFFFVRFFFVTEWSPESLHLKQICFEQSMQISSDMCSGCLRQFLYTIGF